MGRCISHSLQSSLTGSKTLTQLLLLLGNTWVVSHGYSEQRCCRGEMFIHKETAWSLVCLRLSLSMVESVFVLLSFLTIIPSVS